MKNEKPPSEVDIGRATLKAMRSGSPDDVSRVADMLEQTLPPEPTEPEREPPPVVASCEVPILATGEQATPSIGQRLGVSVTAASSRVCLRIPTGEGDAFVYLDARQLAGALMNLSTFAGYPNRFTGPTVPLARTGPPRPRP